MQVKETQIFLSEQVVRAVLFYADSLFYCCRSLAFCALIHVLLPGGLVAAVVAFTLP